MPAEDLLSIQSYMRDEIAHLELGGRLVAESRFDFKIYMRDWDTTYPLQVVVVLRSLDYIDSAGLASLIGGWKKMKELGGELVVAHLNPSLQSIFEVSSLGKFFKIFQRTEDAIQYFKENPLRDDKKSKPAEKAISEEKVKK